jgi:endo-1,4-beta-D-glucanase Y
MDNAANDTRADFDRLWNYYRHFSNANGVMHWKTSGFDTVIESNGASDSELDVALSLLMAWLQWNDEAYLSDARELISAIRTHEFNAAGYLKPGDAWDAAKNPSYFSFVAFRYFAHFDTGHEDFWNDAVTRQYELLNLAAHASTGLVPNWCDESGSPVDPGNGYGPYYGHFGFDAIRVPWRAAWDYLWNGETRGRDVAHRIAGWSRQKTGGQAAGLRSMYTLSGDAVAAYNYTAQAAFTGAIAAACTTDTAHQAYLDALYAQLRNQAGTLSYYHTTLQVLYMALLTGNMPDMRNQ